MKRGKVYVPGESKFASRSARSLSRVELIRERAMAGACKAKHDGVLCSGVTGHDPPHWAWVNERYVTWEE